MKSGCMWQFLVWNKFKGKSQSAVNDLGIKKFILLCGSGAQQNLISCNPVAYLMIPCSENYVDRTTWPDHYSTCSLEFGLKWMLTLFWKYVVPPRWCLMMVVADTNWQIGTWLNYSFVTIFTFRTKSVWIRVWKNKRSTLLCLTSISSSVKS